MGWVWGSEAEHHNGVGELLEILVGACCGLVTN